MVGEDDRGTVIAANDDVTVLGRRDGTRLSISIVGPRDAAVMIVSTRSPDAVATAIEREIPAELWSTVLDWLLGHADRYDTVRIERSTRSVA
jgi:hypothetical protein